jgi:hypothetical protein
MDSLCFGIRSFKTVTVENVRRTKKQQAYLSLSLSLSLSSLISHLSSLFPMLQCRILSSFIVSTKQPYHHSITRSVPNYPSRLGHLYGSRRTNVRSDNRRSQLRSRTSSGIRSRFEVPRIFLWTTDSCLGFIVVCLFVCFFDTY